MFLLSSECENRVCERLPPSPPTSPSLLLLRKCMIWIGCGEETGSLTRRQRGGSTWQSSRHVTDGWQARASAGGEGGGGVDWGGCHGTQVGRVRLFIWPGRRGLGLTRVWWGEIERGRKRRKEKNKPEGQGEKEREREQTGKERKNNYQWPISCFKCSNFSGATWQQHSQQLQTLLASVSQRLCLEVSISWACYATSSVMTHLMFTFEEKIFLFAL